AESAAESGGRGRHRLTIIAPLGQLSTMASTGKPCSARAIDRDVGPVGPVALFVAVRTGVRAQEEARSGARIELEIDLLQRAIGGDLRRIEEAPPELRLA